MKILFKLEKLLHQPDARCDSSILDRLLAEDFFEFGSSGKIWNKKSLIKTLRNEDCIKIQSSAFKAKKLSHDTYLVTYKTVIKSGNNLAKALRSSIWKKSKGRWLMFFHQGTKI